MRLLSASARQCDVEVGIEARDAVDIVLGAGEGDFHSPLDFASRTGVMNSLTDDETYMGPKAQILTFSLSVAAVVAWDLDGRGRKDGASSASWIGIANVMWTSLSLKGNRWV